MNPSDLINHPFNTFGATPMATPGAKLDEQGKLNVFAIEPQMYVSEDQQFGFNKYAEQMNGRLAMIGFVSLLLLEVLSGHGIVGFLANL
jgi:hypothetical protein